MQCEIICNDNYEAIKLSSLIFIKDAKETFISKIINIIENEVVISLKDKSAHSVTLANSIQTEIFADFIQSVLENEHKILETIVTKEKVKIFKGNF